MLKKYKLDFEVLGLLVFLIVMILNFIWFVIPAQNDILRANLIFNAINVVSLISQVLMIIALCFFRNSERKELRITFFLIIAVSCCLVYFICWIVYYVGIVNAGVLIGLTILPCFVFLFIAIDRKNGIAVIFTLVFTVCHLICCVTDFII